ncbi:MAG: hypothetical protein ACE5EQ_10865, partial [Phycisphaerae bacterium]
GLINAIGSLQNIESAEAAGDRFSTGPCMAVNGIGSIAAGLFGSCFPTTIYIGHPGWKALGARCGYSIINGLVFSAVFALGLGMLIVSIIPMEAGMAIVLWIGIVITAQSYEAVPKRHYAAVAISFFPAVAMMAVFLVPHLLSGIGATDGILPMIQRHGEELTDKLTDAWWPIGVYALAGANSGFIITCVIISAASVFLIDRRFRIAAIWCLGGAIMTLLGFQHAYRIEPGAPAPRELLVWQRGETTFENTSLYVARSPGAFWHRGYRIAGGYGAAALLLWGIHWMRRRGSGFEDILVDGHERMDGHGADRPQPTSEDFTAVETDANDRQRKDVAAAWVGATGPPPSEDRAPVSSAPGSHAAVQAESLPEAYEPAAYEVDAPERAAPEANKDDATAWPAEMPEHIPAAPGLYDPAALETDFLDDTTPVTQADAQIDVQGPPASEEPPTDTELPPSPAADAYIAPVASSDSLTPPPPANLIPSEGEAPESSNTSPPEPGFEETGDPGPTSDTSPPASPDEPPGA